VAATIILTEARLECLVTLATHFSDLTPPLKINNDTDVRWVRYQPDTDENILKILTKIASDKSIAPCNLFVAIPYVKGDQQAEVAGLLKDLIAREVTCTWFGAESESDKGMYDACKQTGVDYHIMSSYAPDVVNEFPGIDWEKMEHEQKRNAYVDYRLRHLYMGVGRPNEQLLGILTQLAIPATVPPSFTYTLPSLPGEKGGVLTNSQTEFLVKRFSEKHHPAIAGRSPQIEEVKRLIRVVAMTDLNVLIAGETGTGKEGAAYFIHELSCRRLNPYRELNCAGLDDNYLESTLFGHVKGSYTDADKNRLGLVKVVDGGTIFLDEIPELTPRVQAKILRFIESGEYTPFGSDKVENSHCRIIAAGQPDRIKRDIRPDLFMRLSEAEINLPALRDLGVDGILTIARNRADSLQGERRVPTAPNGATISSVVTQGDVKKFWDLLDETKELLTEYNWPGNTRELFKFIKQSMLLGQPWRELLQGRINKQLPQAAAEPLRTAEVVNAVATIATSARGCIVFLPATSTEELLTVDNLCEAYVQHVYGCLGKKLGKGLSQDALSEKLGIGSNNTFQKYLMGKEEFEIHRLACKTSKEEKQEKVKNAKPKKMLK